VSLRTAYAVLLILALDLVRCFNGRAAAAIEFCRAPGRDWHEPPVLSIFSGVGLSSTGSSDSSRKRWWLRFPFANHDRAERWAAGYGGGETRHAGDDCNA